MTRVQDVVGVRWRGRALGIDPADPETVYADRSAVGAWERARLTSHDEGYFDVWFIEANRQLAIEPGGALASRPAGVIGAWEQFQATTQPEGVSFVYRRDETLGGYPALVLTVEQV